MLKKLKLLEELDKMKYIYRAPYLLDLRQENDAEHCYHLATMVSILAPETLDIGKCLKIALYHDLPEIYAGDTSIHDDAAVMTKEHREKISLDKLSKIMPDSVRSEILELVNEYQNKLSAEARFVYELDKLQPLMMEVLEGWTVLKENKADFNKIYNFTRERVTDEFWLWEVAEYYLNKGRENNIFYKK